MKTSASEIVLTGAHAINNSHAKILADLIEQGKVITITGSSLFGNDPQHQGRLVLSAENINLLRKVSNS
ncbi:MAG TPA: hypothetical protein DD412_06760 [Holosporales bacterium]|nr:hypothetical protein [Holosporales bacterium]